MNTIINDVSLMNGTETTLFSFWVFCVVTFYLILVSSLGICIYDWVKGKFSNK